MPGIVRNYKTGSVVYFMEDIGDSIYILKSGAVSLTYHSIETGEEVRDTIQKGEFFGVKSALAKRPREETALVLKDAQALVLSTEEFERLISSNITIITNFLRVFSNQLRKVVKLVHSFLNHSEVGDSQAELFKIGEYFLKNHKYRQAQYVYETYLKHYKDGVFAAQAHERIKAIHDALEGKGPGTFASMTKEATPPQPGLASPSKKEGPKGAVLKAPAEPASATPGGAGVKGAGDITTKYYEAISLFSQEKFEEAYRLFKSLYDSGTLTEHSKEYLPKIEYEMGRCLMGLKKHKEAVIIFTTMIKNFPKDENIKDALFNIGIVYKSQGDKGKAASFFNKVLSMLPEGPVDRKAKKELAGLGA